ncbi:GNAT family N-acetyltransferase [Georgenia thermotolerans]|uniref:GNAT family N-acetyltransferase n=1 Tax=Georgenia thermotolerans TaxID=527326 RepID=A0A7J5US43_9MICO|nr:GNAT family N-acetyltransferase [Georgenia thermotolerans]KAE8765107.1 GNAT family N-acetyltransferase [Georgenia thermotolerans]
MLRPATAADRTLLREATWVNVNHVADRLSHEDVDRNPQFAHYFDTFPADGDFGYVAEDGGRPVGVAWARCFAVADPGYGFWRADVPELSICVFGDRRGAGIGSALMGAVVAHARREGLPGLSLSVEDGNRARNLYLRHGFVPVGRDGNADTMVLTLG